MNRAKSAKGKVAETFEDLHTYQRARELANAVYAVTKVGAFARDRGLVDQIRRAAVSIMSNIAEGFERGSKTEFIQFLYIAKGSCGEVRAQLQIAFDQQYVSADTHASLTSQARQISGMIANFIAHLQGSEYQGAKFTAPRTQAAEALAERQAALRAAQLVNIRAQQAAGAKQPPPLAA